MLISLKLHQIFSFLFPSTALTTSEVKPMGWLSPDYSFNYHYQSLSHFCEISFQSRVHFVFEFVLSLFFVSQFLSGQCQKQKKVRSYSKFKCRHFFLPLFLTSLKTVHQGHSVDKLTTHTHFPSAWMLSTQPWSVPEQSQWENSRGLPGLADGVSQWCSTAQLLGLSHSFCLLHSLNSDLHYMRNIHIILLVQLPPIHPDQGESQIKWNFYCLLCCDFCIAPIPVLIYVISRQCINSSGDYLAQRVWGPPRLISVSS